MTTAANQHPTFDSHHPPAPALIDQCVHCGFCLPTCPTYALWGEEMDSPRGRIYQMKLINEGQITLTPQTVHHFDTCLGCMACMPVCPSGVQYNKLIEATRAQIERNVPRSAAEKLFRKLIFATFPRPERLHLLHWPLAAYQESGLQKLVRASGVLNLLPKKLRAMETLLPTLGPAQPIAEVTPAVGEKRASVGLLLGCVQREFLSHINAATVRVLAAEGCEVVAPREQSCCGALMVHAGEEPPALELARRTIDVLERAGLTTTLDAIITNAAGCGSNVKDYAWLLRDDPVYASRAAAFSAKCQDISEFLAAVEPRAPRNSIQWDSGSWVSKLSVATESSHSAAAGIAAPSENSRPLRVAFHDSCHLQHAQGVRAQPRALLAQIPKVDLLEIPEQAICCGSAGIYNLVQPNAAQALGDRKAQLIAELDPDVIATGNPGCLLQLQSSLARVGKKIPVVHTVELLDAAIRAGTASAREKR
jgi:glycolate oxidase iron-sulfur subunit